MKEITIKIKPKLEWKKEFANAWFSDTGMEINFDPAFDNIKYPYFLYDNNGGLICRFKTLKTAKAVAELICGG